jgi:serpin B
MRQTVVVLVGLAVFAMPMAAPAQVESLVASNTVFAVNLYGQLATNSGNLFLSPYSISTCLAMLYTGARSSTEQQMSQVLGYGTNQPQFAALFGELQAELKAEQETNAIELNIANALWIQEGFPFLPAFLETATNQYQASVAQADFTTQADAVMQTINNWVAQETQNKIQNLLPSGSLNTQTRLVLANAIYFLGVWTESFASTNTSTQPFFLSSTNQVEVPLMHQPLPTGSGIAFNYMQANYALGVPQTNAFQAMELPYGTNQFSMLILLPADVDGLGQLEQQLSPAFLSNVLAQMAKCWVEVFLPRFTLESSFNLTNTLAAMGMPAAFLPGVADFSGIDGATDLFLSLVFHKAWVQVNEQGTEAAAATGGGVITKGNPYEQFVFRADHPFLFFIRDTQTGSLLFMGRLTDPSQSLAAPPQLAIARSANGMKLSWPYSSTGWTLQQSPDLTRWTPSNGVANDGTNYFITITAPAGSAFFRLIQ